MPTRFPTWRVPWSRPGRPRLVRKFPHAALPPGHVLALIFPRAPLSRCAARARAGQSWCVRASCNSRRRSGQSARKSSMISRNRSASPATRSQRVWRSRMSCSSSDAAGVSGVEAAGAVRRAMTSNSSVGRSGLAHIAIHASSQAALAITLHGMGGHRHNRDTRRGVLLARPNRLRGFQTVHTGHLNIHQDHIKRLPPQGSQSFGAILHHGHGMATLFE